MSLPAERGLDARRVLDAALIAPLVVPFVVAVYAVVISPDYRVSMLKGAFWGFLGGLVFALPVAYLMTALALPLVFLWKRIVGSVGLVFALVLGVTLPLTVVGVPQFIELGVSRGLRSIKAEPELPVLLTLTGAATATTFWLAGKRRVRD